MIVNIVLNGVETVLTAVISENTKDETWHIIVYVRDNPCLGVHYTILLHDVEEENPWHEAECIKIM